jgi:fluoroquinolone transport system permease protein
MWGRLKSSFIADMKVISHDRMLVLLSLTPLLLIILLKLVFPVFSHLVITKSGFLLEKYYTLIAITFVSIIPMLYGMVYAFVLLYENDPRIFQNDDVKSAVVRSSLFPRIAMTMSLSFILILISVLITNPVPSEGWLRTVFVIFLLTIQAPFVFLLICSLADNRNEGLALSAIYGIFLITVPLGMVLHHPWNYLAFFSPLYWIGWTWIEYSAVESLEYGIIAIIITSGTIFILARHFLKNHQNLTF